MKVLVTGAAGMLGSAIIPAFTVQGHEVMATDLRPRVGIEFLDVRDGDSVNRAIHLGYDLVLHLAAETDLEICEQDPGHAELTNIMGTRNVASAAARNNIPMVYIGTAGIFDGEKDGPYTEDDEPNPINVYGRTKWAGEQWAARNTKSYIVRAGWMVGGGDLDHKFVAKIRSQIDEGATSIYAVIDKLGAPTYTRDFAQNLLLLLRVGPPGTYHMVCEGSASRYDVAVEICRILKSQIDVLPVTSEFFSETYFAPRPRSEVMVNAALDALGLNQMRHWKIALEEYLTT